MMSVMILIPENANKTPARMFVLIQEPSGVPPRKRFQNRDIGQHWNTRKKKKARPVIAVIARATWIRMRWEV